MVFYLNKFKTPSESPNPNPYIENFTGVRWLWLLLFSVPRIGGVTTDTGRSRGSRLDDPLPG